MLGSTIPPEAIAILHAKATTASQLPSTVHGAHCTAHLFNVCCCHAPPQDYTLAQYKPETFEQLAYEQTVDKLVTVLGYPKELYSFTFDDKYMCRGLVMDKVGELGCTCANMTAPVAAAAAPAHSSKSSNYSVHN